MKEIKIGKAIRFYNEEAEAIWDGVVYDILDNNLIKVLVDDHNHAHVVERKNIVG